MNLTITNEHKRLQPASEDDMKIYKSIAQRFDNSNLEEEIEAAIYCTSNHKELAEQLRLITQRYRRD